MRNLGGRGFEIAVADVGLNADVAGGAATRRGNLDVADLVALLKEGNGLSHVFVRLDLNVDAETAVLFVDQMLNAPEDRDGENRADEGDDRALVEACAKSNTDCRSAPKSCRSGKTCNLEASFNQNGANAKETYARNHLRCYTKRIACVGMLKYKEAYHGGKGCSKANKGVSTHTCRTSHLSSFKADYTAKQHRQNQYT